MVSRLLLVKYWIITFGVVLCWNTPLWAYSNPILKVLLFKTSTHIDLQNDYGLRIKNSGYYGKPSAKVRFKYAGSKRIYIGRQESVAGSIFVSAEEGIQVIRKGKYSGRRYQGKIELKPYSGGFYVINHVPIERYLEGVLNAEISTEWDLDAVQAQAIIARTFALYKREQRKKRSWHLTAGQYDQVYLGENVSDHRARSAIYNTKGIVIKYRGKLAQTYYHSNCGGTTEDPANVWKFSLPYLKIKSVPYGQNDPKYFWQYDMSFAELAKIAARAGIQALNMYDLSVEKRTKSHRVSSVLISNGNETYRLNAKKFRTLVGYRKIQSLLFDITATNNGYHISGTGNGHGVGLCQWAAKEMAELGYRFDDILRYFYTDTNIQVYGKL